MRIISFILTFITAAGISAQEDLPTGKIEVIKDFEVRLTETRKIRIVPQPIPPDSQTRRYEYRLLAPSPRIEYLTPELKPLAIQPEQKPTYYPLYAKAGYGNPNSLIGAFSYDRRANDVLHWGVDLGHLSANNKKIELQKFSDTRGRINAGYLLNETARIEGYVDARFQKLNFYGAEDIPSNPDALERNYKRYDAALSISRLISQETSFHYKGMLQVLSDKDDLGTQESGVKVGGKIGSALGKSQYPFGLGVLADLSKLKHSEDHKLNNVLVEPFFEYFIGDLKIHLGGIALLRKNNNVMLPAIEASYQLFGDLLVVHAGWKGKVLKNNFHFLSLVNPYIHTRLDSINNEISRRIFAGLRGTAGTFAYEFTGGYTKFESKAFYLQDEVDQEQFVPIYDNGHFIGLEGSIEYLLIKNVKLRAQFFQRFYKPDTENKAWHLPSFGLDAMLTYAGASDTYHVSITAHGENGLPFRTVGGTASRLDPLLDLNLHGDYFITESIGAFAEINNILGNNRERWVTYPTFGFNARAGIVFRLAE